uniref:Tudor domain-containing protein n=1 Tax=Acrobeloides nanus TaxID=290746 RepID=A0A914EDW8_9BILA
MILSSYTSKRLLFLVAISGLSLTAAIYWILKQDEKKKNMSRGTQPGQQAIAEANSNGAVPPKVDSSANNNNQLDLKVVIHDESVGNASDERSLDEADVKTQHGICSENAEHKLSALPSPFSQDSEKTACSIEEVLSGEEHPSFNWAEDVDREEEELSTKVQAHSISDEGHTNGDLSGSGVSVDQEYKNAESPSIRSTNSEGSADSGRATGGPTVYSPFDLNDPNYPPIYEFEIPNTLVGLIIGIKGKTIRELCTRSDVKMLIHPHHTPSKSDTHQICSVQGKRENINKCLHMIRHRFPAHRFPDLNLRPVLPPPLPPPPAAVFRAEPAYLTLPHGAPCEVFISAPVDAGHFFLQLPTHPSFASLQQLDYHMLGIYSQINGVPELPKPCTPGILCAAPAYNGWYRGVTLLYDEAQDEMLVRFVDYGGFARVPRADLKQIRTDLMTLPFQAIECYLAHVQPIDGTSHWSDEANEVFTSLCMSKIIQSELVGHNKNDSIPYVELQVFDDEKKLIKVHEVLLEKGLAKPADPSRLIELPKPIIPPNHDENKAEEAKETSNNDDTQDQQTSETTEAN